MNQLPPEIRGAFDQMILGNPPGTLLVPTCAKELYVLRSIAINWQSVVKAVVEAHGELMAEPTGFGPIDFKLYVTRKTSDGSVIGTIGHEIHMPQEVFEWPLSK